MKILNSTIFDGKNIYSYKKCARIEVDLEGYCEIPSKDILGFNETLVNLIPELRTHRCGIDEDEGFIKRLREGTYLAHICEHIIIAIQNLVDIDVAYGKAREIKDDIYYIIFQYENKRIAIESYKLAIELINKLIEGKSLNFDERISILKEIAREESIGPTTSAICNAAKEMGMPITKLGTSDFYQIGYGKQLRILEAAITNDTSCVATDISCDKMLSKELLEIQQIPVAKGVKVFNVIQVLKEAESLGYPLVIKPQYGSKGSGVVTEIKNEKELVDAYQKVSQNFNDIIMERHHYGNDYRVCVIDNKVVAVSLRVKPYIVGDGKSTIKELIDNLNSDKLRGEGHEKPLTKVKVDESVLDLINEQGYSLTDILESKSEVTLRGNANLSTGGWAIDCTDVISEENKKLCVRVAKTIGLNICGIDICIDDITKSIKNNGIIMEVNAAPGLRMHVHPTEGKSRDVGKAIVNMMYNNEVKNIPIISVTGTNGKTTTTRLISNTLQRMGHCVGMTSTEGIYINDECIDKGDDTGLVSARCILLNKDIDVAVLETARGGLIKRGLAYDFSDVAVVTNITEDHLGVDGIDTMEELCKVKSLVPEVVKEGGYVVINAEDKWSKTILNKIKEEIIYFSKDINNELIMKNISLGKIAVYIKDGYICVNNKKREYRVSKVVDIPITLNGNLEFNIENSMAACAGLVGMGIDYSMIKIGLESYDINSKFNEGRFNIYDYNGIKIILDYAHNIEGYKRVLKDLRKITNSSLIAVSGMPGDRSDEVIFEVGKIIAKNCDKVIIKEDIDRRGRNEGEVSKILLNGVTSSDKNKEVKVVLDEQEAFKQALKTCSVGDTIIVFYEIIEPLIEMIEELKRMDYYFDNVVNYI